MGLQCLAHFTQHGNIFWKQGCNLYNITGLIITDALTFKQRFNVVAGPEGTNSNEFGVM